MKIHILITVLVGMFQIGYSQDYTREWATYFGDGSLYIKGAKEFRGNLYLVGSAINSSNIEQLVSEDSYQTDYGGGERDGFIAKFSFEGQLVWFTYYGGSGNDMITDIIADQNNIYVVGETSSDNLATLNSYQTTLNGENDGFIASFDEFGNLNWHTYFGGDKRDRIISLTHRDNSLYMYGYTTSHNDIATEGAYQQTLDMYGNEGNYINNFIAEFDKSGNRIWATYYGIIDLNSSSQTYPKTPISGIAVNDTGLYVMGWDMGQLGQSDTTYFGTSGAFLETRPVAPTGIGMSLYLSKFSLNGSRLWSTYFSSYNSAGFPASILSSYSNDPTDYRSLTATSNGVYFSGWTVGNFGVATSGSFQPTKTGGSSGLIVHFSNEGERVWGSYFGNEAISSPPESGNLNTLSFDDSGNIYISGSTSRTNDISTSDGYQLERNGKSDFFLGKISEDGTTKLYGTYFGGSENETYGWCIPMAGGDSFYLIGATSSTSNMTTEGAWQEDFLYGGGELNNIIIAKFSIDEGLRLEDISENRFSVYPNPANTVISILNPEITNFSIKIYDVLGKQVMLLSENELKDNIDISNLSQGVYFIKINTNQKTDTFKFIKK